MEKEGNESMGKTIRKGQLLCSSKMGFVVVLWYDDYEKKLVQLVNQTGSMLNN
jgi:hypothetical protein